MSTGNVTPIRSSSGPSTSASPPAKPPRKKRRASLSRAELAERIENERGKLFRAMGVVSVVRQVLKNAESEDSSAMYNAIADGWCALDAAYEVMNDVAGAMEADVFLREVEARS